MPKTVNFPSPFFFNNRRSAFSMMANNSVMFILSAIDKTKNGDTNYKFRQDSNFFYLTGLNSKRTILALVKIDGNDKTYLFDYYNNSKSSENIEIKTKLKRAKIEQIESHEKLLDFYNHIFIDLNLATVYLYNEPFAKNILPTYTQLFAENLKKRFHFIHLKSANKIMTSLRIIKQPIEIKMIKKATLITKEAIDDLTKHFRQGIYESECEAILSYNYLKKGTSHEAFTPTVALGANTLIFNYEENNCKAKKNDILLVDTGSAYNYYATDITRTYPIKGKFTPIQKKIYQIVLDAHNEILKNIKPGITFESLEEICLKSFYKSLKRNHFINKDVVVKKFFPHKLGHFVGLDVHDLGNYTTKFKPGMVIAIEPALYIKEKSIGMRIENVILITKTGYEIISKEIPYKLNEMEIYLNRESTKLS